MFPYKVKVNNTNGEVKVSVTPPPAPKDPEKVSEISERFQNIIVSYQGTGTLKELKKLQKELIKALKEYHSQGLIEPKS